MSRNRSFNSPLGLGIPTMLCIAAVLALSILAVLSYMNALNVSHTAEREIAYTRAYYQADIEAQRRLTQTKEDLSFEVALDDGRVLEVVRENGKIIKYQIVEGE